MTKGKSIPQGPSPAFGHVSAVIERQMEASQQVLMRLRRGKRLFPRLAVVPALVVIVSVFGGLGAWAIVLSIGATTSLLLGALTYALVERRLVKAIRESVEGLEALSRSEREELLRRWLSV